MLSADTPSSPRRPSWPLLAAILVLAAILIFWLWPGKDGEGSDTAGDRSNAHGRSGGSGGASGPDLAPPPIDPLTPAAVVGTITDLEGSPLAGARVCARPQWPHDRSQPPPCTTSEADGHYRLAPLAADALRIYASADQHQPGDANIELSPGAERRVDFELLGGAVEIHGVVYDLAGGEVEGALLTIEGDPIVGDPQIQAMTLSDEQGRFSAWVRPGRLLVRAAAAGYANYWLYSAAPGPTVEVYLVPEAVLVGRVVDAESGEPIAGVEVDPGLGGGGIFFAETSHGWARSDEQGRFRITGLNPGAYRPYVANGHWRGQAAQTVKLGLGETSERIEVPVIRASTIRARVLTTDDRPTCLGGSATVSAALFESYAGEVDDAGVVEIGGLPPGDYDVDLHCDGHFHTDVAQATLVAGQDLDEQRWTIPAGFTLRGEILTQDGAPLPGRVVLAELIPEDDDERGPTARRSRSGPSDKRGGFVLHDLEPGTYELSLGGSAGAALPKPIEIEVRAEVEGLRLEVPTPITLVGRVVDAEGAPVPDLTITAYGAGGPWQDTRSDDAGGFTFTGLGPDHYRVVALDGRWQFERGQAELDVAAGERGEVEIVVGRSRGVIRGRVIDDGGTPLDDAFISLERQQDRRSDPPTRGRLSYSDNRGRPVLSDADGRFEVGGLPEGLYTVRAQQRQGGETVRSNVAVGARIELVIEAVATMAGTVVIDPAPAGDAMIGFSITAHLADGSLELNDQWSNPSGQWRFEDLPPGRYTLTAESPLGDGSLEVELAPGAALEDLRLELLPRVQVSGRLIDESNQQPIADAEVRIPSGSFSGPGRVETVRSGADGRFSLRAPVGSQTLRVIPAGSEAGRRHQSLRQTIEVQAGQPLELGDLALAPSDGA